ncbi:MAG: glycosyl hydrolase 53 family protein [Oscillospiraceae bacterium]|nr:glycosyl hydrolase 53 family protein [Oscillospiraceae bacterium]
MKKRNNLNRIIALMLSLVLVFTMTGCGSQSNDDAITTEETTVEAVADTDTDASAETIAETIEYHSELVNGDFETQDFEGWTVEESSSGVVNVQTDDWATVNTSYFAKMYSYAGGSFTLSQYILVEEAGTYVGGIYYEGSSTFEGTLTFYVLVNDVEVAVLDITPTLDWDVWTTAITDEIVVEAGDVVTIRISGELGANDWGDIDNVVFVAASEKDSIEASNAGVSGEASASDSSSDDPLGGASEDYGVSPEEANWDIQEVGATGSGSIDFSGITYNGTVINDGDWIKGVDVSSLISLEKSGVVYYNADGEEEDLLAILKDAGVNYVRVRVWNDPYAEGEEKTPENSYGGGVCDLAYTCEIAERCAELGLTLYVDFHYSDFWSDPSRSYAPKAWADYSLEEKQAAIAEYTTEALEQIAATGVDIGIVSVGNETNSYLAGESGMENIAQLIAAGCEAVREFDDSILIAVRFTSPDPTTYYGYANMLAAAGADYDIFSSSYYPFWHGTLENLTESLNGVAQAFGKLTMIAEYSYGTSGAYGDEVEDVFGTPSEDGQVQAITVLNEAAAQIDYCIGTFYWEPAWILTSSDTWASEGSGWINTPAAEYDLANSTVSEAQGSACYNEALFDADGNPYKAITEEVFNQIWTDGE